MGLTEPRCPECGTSFTWGDVLADDRAATFGLFEFDHARHPIRSLARTWFGSLAPARPWNVLDMHPPPRVRALLIMGAALTVGFALVTAACLGLIEAFAGGVVPYGLSGSGGPGFGPPTALLAGVLPMTTVSAVVLVGVAWCGASLLAVLAFAHSLLRHHVRAVHMLRVWAYSVPTTLVALPVALVPICVLDATLGYPLNYVRVFGAVSLLALLHVVASLRAGLAVYARMDHAWAMAAASQVVAVLAALALCNLFVPDFVPSLMYALMDLQSGG